MRIAIILYRLNVKGGTQRQALELARELQKQGHKVKIYAFYYDREKTYKDLLGDTEITSLSEKVPGWREEKKIFGVFSRPSFLLGWLADVRGAKTLAGLISQDTNILNPHGNPAYMVSYYFKKEIKNIPAVWMLNTMPSKTWGFWKKKITDPNFQMNRLKWLFYRALDFYEALIFIRPHTVIVLDNADKEYARKYLKKDAQVIRSGLNIENFRYKERTSPAGKNASILLSGIFFEYRRFEDALVAVKILKDRGYKLVVNVVGDYFNNPDYHHKLVNLIEKLDLGDAIRFLGVVSDKEFVEMRQNSDIAIFPYHLQSWGLAVFEAMACGTPVIVSRTLGASEVLTDGENALLVNPKSPEEIAAALERLLNDPGLYLRLSRNGRKFVEENISWSKYTREMLSVFSKALEALKN